MASERINRLNTMASNFPVMDEQAEKREQAGIDIQLQQGIGGAPKTGNVKQTSQAMAPAAAQASGAVANQFQQRMNANQQAIGQQTVQAAQQEGATQLAQASLEQQQALASSGSEAQLTMQEADIANRKTITSEELAQAQRLQAMGIAQDNRLLALTIEQRETIAGLGSDVKDQLFDAQMRFQEDELGRKFTNERQLADYAKANATTEIEFQSMAREMQQASQKELIMLEAAHAKIVQALKQKTADNKQKLDQESMRRLQEAEKKMNEAIAKKRKKAGIMTAVLVGGGAVAGAVATGGTPAGAMVGASVGQAAAGAIVAGSE